MSSLDREKQRLRQYRGTLGLAASLTIIYIALFLVAEYLYNEPIYHLLDSTWGAYSPQSILLSPWGHTTHSNFLNNLLLFIVSSAAVERITGTKALVVFTAASGYFANLLPPILGIGGPGVGISGAFYGLWTIVATLYFIEFLDDVFNGLHYSSILILFLTTWGLTTTKEGIFEFFGLSTPNPGIAVGAHFIGVLFGLLFALTWLATNGRSRLAEIVKPDTGDPV